MHRPFGPWLDHFTGTLDSGMLAVDIGCGHGDDTRVLVNAGLQVAALDRDRRRVGHASSNVPEAFFVVADLRVGLPFRDQAFDLAVASLSLHYFDRSTTDRIVRDIHRVLRPGATLLSRVNVVGDARSLWGVGIEHEPDYFEVEPGHFKRFFTEETLRDALVPGFEIIELFPMTTLVDDRQPKQTLVARARRRNP